MWEHTNPEPDQEQDNSNTETTAPTHEDSAEQLRKAKIELDFQKRMRTTATDRLIEFERKFDRAEEYITENWDSLDIHAEELCEVLGIDAEITKTITLSISVDVEVSAPRGFNFDEITTYDFDVEITQASNEDWSIDNVNAEIDDLSVD